MTHIPTWLKPFLLCVVLATASLSVWAGEGHDHGEAPAMSSGPAKPRFTAVSEAFELVGVVNGKKIALYLDHVADNSPVKDATLELELGGLKVPVRAHGEGEFEATMAAVLPPGEISVTATVLAGAVNDLLAGDLDVHADTHAEPAHAMPWKTYTAWTAAGLALLATMAFLWRRLGAHRGQRVGGAA